MYVNTSDNSFYIGNSENAPVKLITELNIGDYETGGGDEPSTKPELPDKDSLTVGNTVMFAGHDWIVSHKTADSCYLTLKGLSGESTWKNLQSACTTFAYQFTEAQKACLKSVTAGNTSGIVFVATREQMNGGFSYFNSKSRRRAGRAYWTSTERDSDYAWLVNTDGDITLSDGLQSFSLAFRPSVCIDLTLYT